MTERFYLNRKWKYTEEFSGSLLLQPMEGGKAIEIPHTMCETPFHYIDSSKWPKEGIYQRVFTAPKDWRGKALLLTFEGVAHKASVYVNGALVATNTCGYNMFSADISTKVDFGSKNLITVRVDAGPTLNQPPFTIKEQLLADYTKEEAPVDEPAFGGIYRDVYLEVKELIHMKNVFCMATTTLSPDTTSMTRDRLEHYAIPGKVETWVTLSKEAKKASGEHRLSIRQYLNEHEISNQPLGKDGKTVTLTGPVKIWDIDSPTCYRVQTDLIYDGTIVDTHITQVGFRDAVFRASGFYLNGRRVKLRGIVRHQVYPYVGYAMPESIQRHDAKILKEELYANAVRTAHCPPDSHFLDACDRMGLLVFVEIPGWKQVGDKEWKEKCLQNVESMILAHRNHPSIVLWGTRVSGSFDNTLDKEAAELARALDPLRQTGGDRSEHEMHSAEDVYTYSDYSFDGTNEALETKEAVSDDMAKPYVICSYLGQSFPVKTSDANDVKSEQIRRAAKVLDAAIEAEDVCGTFAESMCDYVTRAEFADEDGVAYHGFLDAFRNHKPVAALMAAQNRQTDILEVSSPMSSDKERWNGYGSVYIITNADKVNVYRDDMLIKEYTHKDSPFTFLRNGPIPLTDYVGGALEETEGYPKDQIKRLKRMLNHFAINGLGFAYANPSQIVDMFMTRFVYRMGKEEIADLYDRYISAGHTWRFEAIRNGVVSKKLLLAPGKNMFLRTDISSQNLIERHGYDVVAVRVRITDDSSRILQHYAESLRVQIEGPLALIGPGLIPFRGGMCGLYVRSIGQEGQANVYLSCPGAHTVRLNFNIMRAPEADI